MKKLIGLLLLCLTSSSMSLTISRVATPPKIDGNLDEPAWKTAEAADMKEYSGGTVKNRTTVQLAYDADNLYVAFTCFESRMDRIKTTWNHFEERDNAVWGDDCVEMLFDPFGSGFNYYHIIINSAGVIADCRNDDWHWNAGVNQGIRKGKDRWIVEMAIPFTDLGYLPTGGEVWRGNLGRSKAKPFQEISALFPTGGFSFADLSTFGPLTFQAESKDAAFSLTKLFGGQLRGTLKNAADTAGKFQILVRTQKDQTLLGEETAKLDVPALGEVPVEMAYNADAGTIVVEVKRVDSDGAKTIYSNSFENRIIDKKAKLRVWQIENPLYKELFSDEPLELVKKGVIFWAHGSDYNSMRLLACQYGMRYAYDEFMKTLGENNLTPLTTGPNLLGPSSKIAEYSKKYGLKVILLADARGGPTPEILNGPFLPDPKATEYYIEKMVREIQQAKDKIWAVSLGDEVNEYNEWRGIDFFATMKDQYPYIVEADREIKEKYGDGKYGIPLSRDDNNPYRWIAYRKWMNEKVNNICDTLYKRIKAVDPNLVVISPDPIAFHHPFDFSRWKSFSDIMTHQLYPRLTDTRADFGFYTKLIRDISGVEEVWPCMHVENYATSFTTPEVIELVSQAFRNGATGFHYYLCDTIGRYAKKQYMHSELFCAPDRWQIEMALLAEARKMNRLKFPKPDFAIFYSCDSYASQLMDKITDEIEVAYTFTGPVAGSWFKFIDDYQIERGTVNLADFKVVYIPYAFYQRESVVAKLAEYVKNGGVIVCGDPEVFSQDPVGNDLGDWRKKLFGVETAGPLTARNILYKQTKLPIFTNPFLVKPVADATVLAKFDNGEPAIVSHDYGKGRTIYFAVNPFRIQALGDDNWKTFFKGLQSDLKLAVNHDIWRFRFPESLIKPLDRPAGKCLTNNHIFWEGGQPLGFTNVETKGTYSYSFTPDAIGDEGGQTDVSFERGDLTDRRKASTAGNVDLGGSKLEEWVVRYGKTDPTAITFDFEKAYPVEKVVLFYTGQLPDVTVEISTDGRTWQPFASADGKPATEDVYDLTLSGDPTSARCVRVNFGSRTEQKEFTLAELEVWAK
jgi:hypothetical protein